MLVIDHTRNFTARQKATAVDVINEFRIETSDIRGHSSTSSRQWF